MKHRVAGRKLGRTSAHRLALLRNLATALFERERIRTTLMKAKELRPFAEKLITLAKRETLHARRQVLRHVHDRTVVAKLFETLSARFAQRPGGYTRILKLGPRRGDAAEMALIELVGFEAVASKKKGGAKGKGAKAAPEAEAAVREGEEPAEEKPLEKSAGKKAPAKKAKETGKAKKPKAAEAKGKGKPAKPDAKAAKKPAKKGGKGSEE